MSAGGFDTLQGAEVVDLQFWLLGPLQVWRGETRLDPSLTSHRLRALLALCLTLRDQFVSADRLIESLWPDVSPTSAANSLQVAVSQLRRWLEPNLQRAGDSRYLRTEATWTWATSPTPCSAVKAASPFPYVRVTPTALRAVGVVGKGSGVLVTSLSNFGVQLLNFK